MLTFLEMNAGPEYPFYNQIAQTKITLWICLLLGPCMPVMYAVALLALSIQYVTDRLTLAYFHRLPPMYSDRLTLSLVTSMTNIPLVQLGIVFWLYTNNQMFENRIDPIQVDNEVRRSHHTLLEIQWEKLGVAELCLLLTIGTLLALRIFTFLKHVYEEFTESEAND